MRLIWAGAARADLVAIRGYIAEHNPQAANEIAGRILRAAELLSERPRLGLLTHRSDTRRLIVGHSVYSTIYRIGTDDLEILEIFDGRRRAPRTDMGD
jgi:toxin ParE1/3/4